MIKTRTVFVVGAGASVPYGLPSGVDLLEAARNLDPSGETGIILCQGLPSWEMRKANLLHFTAAVKRYRGPSIDAFLEDWPAFREIGHEVIAALMGPLADEARKSRAEKRVKLEDDWLNYLTQKMRIDAGTWERFCENPITFVTFNFDTVIEEEMSEALHSFYGQVADVNRLPQVIHVHGRLPTYRGLTQRWVADAAQQLKVVHDELDPVAVEEAQDAIKAAEVVCFLGMSYQAANLQTIDSPWIREPTKRREYFGTAYKLPKNEERHAKRWFPVTPVFGPEGCREFLSHHNVLRW